MPISAEIKIPKETTNTQVSFNVAPIAAIENTQEKSWFSTRRATINPPPFDVSGTIDTAGGTTTVTASSSNGFEMVKVGDPVALSPNNTSGAVLSATTVASKPDNNTITLTDDATDDGSGASILRFDPAQLTPTLYGIKEVMVYQGPTITVEVWLYEYDGTLGATNGTDSNATKSRKIAEFNLDGLAFLGNVRVMRSDQNTLAL